jgi:hypothetical protein
MLVGNKSSASLMQHARGANGALEVHAVRQWPFPNGMSTNMPFLMNQGKRLVYATYRELAWLDPATGQQGRWQLAALGASNYVQMADNVVAFDIAAADGSTTVTRLLDTEKATLATAKDSAVPTYRGQIPITRIAECLPSDVARRQFGAPSELLARVVGSFLRCVAPMGVPRSLDQGAQCRVPLIATPSRRRLAMAAMLGLAVAGAVIRTFAANPSTLRDVGTLLEVMWLPAVGNLIAYLVQKIPRRAPPVTTFPAGSAFTPQLEVRIEASGLPNELLVALDPSERQCTLIVGRSGFTARLAEPIAHMLASPGPQTVALELLHVAHALPRLLPGTNFHLLAGTTAVAKGSVLP